MEVVEEVEVVLMEVNANEDINVICSLLAWWQTRGCSGCTVYDIE